MAEQNAIPAGPTGSPATPPRILPWLLLYTLGRLLIAAVLVALVWVAGLPGFPGAAAARMTSTTTTTAITSTTRNATVPPPRHVQRTSVRILLADGRPRMRAVPTGGGQSSTPWTGS